MRAIFICCFQSWTYIGLQTLAFRSARTSSNETEAA